MTPPNKNPAEHRTDTAVELTARNFPSAHEEAQALKAPSRYAGPESAYRLAFTDDAFLLREELRPVRMQLELLKPELVQAELGIESTIVIFGSARILSPEAADAALLAAQANQGDPGDESTVRRTQMQQHMSRFYDEARRFAALVTERSRTLETPIYVVTGGGPGIMEAGNRGAHEVGGKSIGLNIVLPHEQEPNAFITPELCFQFHYFALRKMHFLMRSIALVCFPGGFGTLDELFETMTLVQTGKSRRRPILLFGREFWTRLINFDWLIETGMISPGDVNLFHFVETAEDAWRCLADHYGFDLPETRTGEFADYI
ncbi:LOG family protein [Sphaerotilus microaerophilus]|jgi:hypothetical protein|uniref:AMP nucleosidase n=1 Tax=Sphaerotilus microaerophilus TaxID=2914710 RepID=A0ABN6PP24_9BURK|nr:LOG family protein [Sphaerotilus sp. FB-5]BDI05778.1 lysine decarboxylase [Sphaerotilus sp. FB-5]